MTLSPRRLVACALVASVLLTGSACDFLGVGDDEEGLLAGGTLRADLTGWPTHLDPQLIATPLEANISKLVTRTLTTFRPDPAAGDGGLVADLATDTGQASPDGTIWEFTLREGVRWEDGEPVTCRDLKYGVERRYAPDADRQTGATVPFQYLSDNPEPYQGPWVGDNNDGAGLESVQCVDRRVIRYHLAKPVSDFNFAVSLPVFAPVREDVDDDLAGYDQAPLATGPYRVAEGEVGGPPGADNRLVLERNPYWAPASDEHRPAYPDRIVLEGIDEVDVTTRALIRDEEADRSRILLDTNLAPTFLQQVMTDPELSERVASGPMGSVRYLPINTELVPEAQCRQAVALVVNKRSARAVFGGELLGELATGMIPPSLPAHLAFDHHQTHEFPGGQPDRAWEVLQAADDAGSDCPETMAFAHPDRPELHRLAAGLVDDLQRIGIHLRPDPIPADDYLTSDGVLGERAWELAWIGLSPAWPNGSAVIPSLFDSRSSGPGSAGHLHRLDDERINTMIDAAFAEPDLERQFQLWGEIDRELMAMAVAVPIMYDNALRLHGSNVRGALVHPQLAMPDLSVIGLVDPTLSDPSQD